MYERVELAENDSIEISSEQSYDEFDAEKHDKAMIRRATRYATYPTTDSSRMRYLIFIDQLQ